jgi:hypothetical protein
MSTECTECARLAREVESALENLAALTRLFRGQFRERELRRKWMRFFSATNSTIEVASILRGLFLVTVDCAQISTVASLGYQSSELMRLGAKGWPSADYGFAFSWGSKRQPRDCGGGALDSLSPPPRGVFIRFL